MSTENRVRYDKFGPIPAGDPRLVAVPTAGTRPQQYLHWIAARDFMEMREAAQKEAGLDLRLASGWRSQRFATEEAYNAFVIGEYGSVAEGRKYLAYKSAHQTGLALDFGSEGLAPTRHTIAQQRKTPAFLWLDDNAHRWGYHPYKVEPWHWGRNMTVAEHVSLPSHWGRDLPLTEHVSLFFRGLAAPLGLAKGQTPSERAVRFIRLALAALAIYVVYVAASFYRAGGYTALPLPAPELSDLAITPAQSRGFE